MEEILTTQEVADFLKVTTSYIYQLKSAKKIPFHNIGKSTRFIKSEIIEWVKTDGVIATA